MVLSLIYAPTLGIKGFDNFAFWEYEVDSREEKHWKSSDITPSSMLVFKFRSLC